MLNLKDEISRTIPDNAHLPICDGREPVLFAFGCVLLERYTGKSYIYTAVNLTDGRSEFIARKTTPLTVTGAHVIVDQIRQSKIAGPSRYLADRPVGKRISLEKAHEILLQIFHTILPSYGYTVRKEQGELAIHNLIEIARRNVTIAEAGVGTGKTLAYLTAAVIAKRGRINDLWNMGLYPQMQYADMSKMPIVISTSSIALQRALINEYIPELSRILMENGIIKCPLTAVLRKGREHYVCEYRLQMRLATANDVSERYRLKKLLSSSEIDLAEIDITPKIKRKISVPQCCYENCYHRENCRYLKFRQQAQSLEIDIHVCNHNYLIADTLARTDSKSPLIPNYQMLIIDEAHKLLQAAQSMYCVDLLSISAPEILDMARGVTFKRKGFLKIAQRATKKLFDESARLFKGLTANANPLETEDETDRLTALIDKDEVRHLKNIRDISERLLLILRDQLFFIAAEDLLEWVREKYGANIQKINLKQMLSDTFGDTRDAQKQRMQNQLFVLHQAICKLPEIRRISEIEVANAHNRSRSFDPERDLMFSENSTVSSVILRKINRILPVEKISGQKADRIIRLIGGLEKINQQSAYLARHNNLIYWLEKGEGNKRLCAIPKNLGQLLFLEQWSKGIPTILTSGTLSGGAGINDFSHIKRTLGLNALGEHLTEISRPSPFDYYENALLYISENVPFPHKNDEAYIANLTDEIERLLIASQGHAAVLFTSYNTMGIVHATLMKRCLPFPMFRLGKGSVQEIERFKKSGNGVLFASGSLWEGIDIPGDALSLLIIVKLPFDPPDPIGEHEQTLYESMGDYKDKVIIPQMLIKLKQGFGRLLRTEKDNGAVALLDSRVNTTGPYRRRVLDALPNCYVTSSIDDIRKFMRAAKNPKYFK